MMKFTKKEILSVLEMPGDEFEKQILAKVKEQRAECGVTAIAMLGYSNICKNRCLYCGMRAENKIPRYRIEPDEVVAMGKRAYDAGLRRIFLVSGEDMGYGFEKIVSMCEGLRDAGLSISLAAGEYDACRYAELKSAGVDEYVMKFEMSHEDSFNRLNPSTSFRSRMAAIEAVKASGMKLASGNIIDWPGQTADELSDDILLTCELGISWAPVLPYMPALGTPLAAEGKRGNVLTALKEIALLRLLLPDIDITAQQPGENLKNGLADPEGNMAAINAGANLLFCDLLPDAQAKSFRVIDERNVTGMGHILDIARRMDMKILF